MKVILSRKGFDSGSEEYPSPILPNGKIISLPIRDPKEPIKYSDLKLDFLGFNNYYDLMKSLGIKITKKTGCHLDPDIYKYIQDRDLNWKPCFGQQGEAQKHLDAKGINGGDLFLFFGRFKETKFDGKGLKFTGPDRHIIFGYLQIDKRLKDNFPRWLKDHPHYKKKGNDNTIYIPSRAGTFNLHKDLILTKKGKFSKSRWELPAFFRKCQIVNETHNKDKPLKWTDEYFDSNGYGQEFVIIPKDDDKDTQKRIEKWVEDLIKKGMQKDLLNSSEQS